MPLDAAAVAAAARELLAEGGKAICIWFLFSYLNPAHALRAAGITRAVMTGVFVTASATISPQFREFERFTSAALAAFVGPKVGDCVTHLETALQDAGLGA